MATLKVEVTDTWQLVVSSGTSFTLQITNASPILVAFDTSTPTSDGDAFILHQGQGLNDTYGASSANCYVKRKGTTNSAIVISS